MLRRCAVTYFSGFDFPWQTCAVMYLLCVQRLCDIFKLFIPCCLELALSCSQLRYDTSVISVHVFWINSSDRQAVSVTSFITW